MGLPSQSHFPPDHARASEAFSGLVRLDAHTKHMRHLITSLVLALCLAGPALSQSVSAMRDPLSYPLKQWALVLGLALFGGFASWWAKVRKGELQAHNLMALIGELTISAFVGVIVFYGCEYMRFDPLLTAALVGIAGHMGTRAISFIESIAEKRVRERLGG